MRRMFLSLISIMLLFTMFGCFRGDEPKILFDEEITININDEYEVNPIVEGLNKEFDLLFISQNNSIFITDGNIIIPKAVGRADLIIRIYKTDIEIKVSVNIEEIELKFANLTFNIIKGEELILILLGDELEITQDITWSSSDQSVASVNSEGVVLGKGVGPATIKANYKGSEIETLINVTNAKDVASDIIKVSGIKIVEIDEVIMLTGSSDITPATFVFNSLNEDIATITTSGILKGISEGIATINVSLKEDESINFSFDITVIVPKLEISISPNSEMIIGDRSSFVTVKDSRGLVISRYLCEFRSLDNNILTVGADGSINTVGVGKVKIEVKYKKSIGEIEVIVNEAPELNYRNLLVQTAINEYGYIEGYNNDTKYGDWYGMPNQPWCAMFVSWCANEIGIPLTIIPKYAAVALGLDWYQAKGNDYYKSYEETQNGDYIPICGDIIFFKSNGASHTGIVVKVIGDIMYTIEGNTSNRVALRYYYYKNYDKITGYGVPDYQASSGPIYDFDVTRATFGGGVSTN